MKLSCAMLIIYALLLCIYKVPSISPKVNANDSKVEEHICIVPSYGLCPSKYVTFHLYTRLNQDNPYTLTPLDTGSLKNAPFISNAPLKFLVHGYTGDKNFSPNSEIRPAYFEKGEYNIISIDYGPLVKEGCYIQSRQNVNFVAECFAQLIDFIIDNTKFKRDEVHIIAYSLGAQVASKLRIYLQNGIPERITALDPAQPLFVLTNGVSTQAAKFVDVIHTDALTRGLFLAAGHIDFYVNGGFSQPGCKKTAQLTKSSCNHGRAPVYFAESINADMQFLGLKCSNYLLFLSGFCRDNIIEAMGEYTLPDAKGVYYLRTNTQSPYALGLEGIYYNATA